MSKIRLQDWFDVSNKKHIQSFVEYTRSGEWNISKPDNVFIDQFSGKDITYKITNHWINHVLAQPDQYDPEFGDDRECRCGHPYYRHFDTYEDMAPVGCKYCCCYNFEEGTYLELIKDAQWMMEQLHCWFADNRVWSISHDQLAQDMREMFCDRVKSDTDELWMIDEDDTIPKMKHDLKMIAELHGIMPAIRSIMQQLHIKYNNTEQTV